MPFCLSRRGLLAAFALCLAIPALAQEAKKDQADDLTWDAIFPKKGHFGKRASGMTWSHDDRYVAYRWNAYDDKGYDLWLYDVRERKARRVTSPEYFLPLDRDLKDIIERYKKDKEEDERRKKLSEDERKKLEDEDEKKEKDRKEPLKEYSGIGEFVWAEKSDEMLITYRGDIYRLALGKDTLTRLTKTKEDESGVKWLKDDKGFLFRRGQGIFRMAFDSPVVTQLDPKLPDGVTVGSYWLSPDETKILVSGSKAAGKTREVTYATYRDRFTAAKTAGRAVADDPFDGEQYLFIADLIDDPKSAPFNDGKPWEIWKWPGGEEMGQMVLNETPWSPDSMKVTFATWKRTQRALEVWIADVPQKKVANYYRTTHSGEHTTPGMTDPFCTPDGKQVVLLLEQSGYRHVWVLDPLAAGATQITRGSFDVHPLKIAKDGKSLIVRSTKENPSRMDLYRVELPDGKMERLTSRDGNYSGTELSHDLKKAALTFGSWKSQTEMYMLPSLGKNEEVQVTTSHPGTLAKVNKITPELFTYPNRIGQTISGYALKPRGWKKGDKRPLLIYVYGGPLGEGKSVVDGGYGSDGYWFPMYMAWKYGYLCVTIDPRGSSGYGGAFGAANWEQPGKPQVEDLTDGVKWLSENWGVDATKVGIHGWSFGGFQTQMCMYTAPDVFTLGIAGAGPTEWQNYNNWYSGGVIGPAKVGKPDELDKFSLTHLAKDLKGSLMLLHGMEDTNVLYQDTVKVYRELLKAGKGPLVELVVDPTGGHGMGGDMKTKDRFAIYEAFVLRRWGKPEKAQ